MGLKRGDPLATSLNYTSQSKKDSNTSRMFLKGAWTCPLFHTKRRGGKTGSKFKLLSSSIGPRKYDSIHDETLNLCVMTLQKKANHSPQVPTCLIASESFWYCTEAEQKNVFLSVGMKVNHSCPCETYLAHFILDITSHPPKKTYELAKGELKVRIFLKTWSMTGPLEERHPYPFSRDYLRIQGKRC